MDRIKSILEPNKMNMKFIMILIFFCFPINEAGNKRKESRKMLASTVKNRTESHRNSTSSSNDTVMTIDLINSVTATSIQPLDKNDTVLPINSTIAGQRSSAKNVSKENSVIPKKTTPKGNEYDRSENEDNSKFSAEDEDIQAKSEDNKMPEVPSVTQNSSSPKITNSSKSEQLKEYSKYAASGQSHILRYMLLSFFICLLFMAAHNRKKIIGCILEGRDKAGSSTRYRRLSQSATTCGSSSSGSDNGRPLLQHE